MLASTARIARGVSQCAAHGQRRGLKILCALYADPKTGYPPKYARESIPEIKVVPNNSPAPKPKALDFKPGELLGCVSGGLGLRSWLESLGHEYIVTADKDGPNSEFEKHLPDADIVISQPFYPAYITPQRFAKAKKLKLAITAGIGSDHVDLSEACKRKVDVIEVSGSNSISVAEHQAMTLLILVRNFVAAHQIAVEGRWDVADAVSRSYDLEGLDVATLGAGRIGRAVMHRLKPFGVKLHYFDQYPLKPEEEKALGAKHWTDMREMVKNVDACIINVPLYPGTENLFNRDLINSMRRGSYIVNCARGKIVDRDAIVEALESGQLAGYGGDVWFPQPAPADHPWRKAPFNAMVPHISGTSLSAQTRYAAGTREILENYLANKPIRDEWYIVRGGALAGAGAHAYKPGNATGGAH